MTQLIKERDNQIKKLEDDIRRLQNGKFLLDEPTGSNGSKMPCQNVSLLPNSVPDLTDAVSLVQLSE